jgi:hypothetical protein
MAISAPTGLPVLSAAVGKRIYAPAIELRQSERCEIVLNNRSPNPIDVTPTFYTTDGNAIIGNPVQLAS